MYLTAPAHCWIAVVDDLDSVDYRLALATAQIADEVSLWCPALRRWVSHRLVIDADDDRDRLDSRMILAVGVALSQRADESA